MPYNKKGFTVDFSVLVDIISNAAGMMILFACMALLIRNDDPVKETSENLKPINFPLAYLPTKKTTVIIALKDGRLHELPGDALLKEVIRQNKLGNRC